MVIQSEDTINTSKYCGYGRCKGNSHHRELGTKAVLSSYINLQRWQPGGTVDWQNSSNDMVCVKPYHEIIYLPTGTEFWPSTITPRIFWYVNSSSSFDFQTTKYHRSVESSKFLANAFASFRCCPVVPGSQTNIFIFAQAERKRAVNIFDTPMMAMAYHIQVHMGFTT